MRAAARCWADESAAEDATQETFLREGISCPSSSCQSFVPPPAFAAAFSDDNGQFKLDGVPSGSNVPLVVETGKWRRQTAIPSVTACAATPLIDPELTRLPRTQSEGHLPRIALVTGHASSLECLLRTIGIADAEFTNDAGNGRVHLYVGGAGDFTLAGTSRGWASGSIHPRRCWRRSTPRSPRASCWHRGWQTSGPAPTGNWRSRRPNTRSTARSPAAFRPGSPCPA